MIKKKYLFLIMLVCLFAISAVNANEIANDTNMVVNDYDSGLMIESIDDNFLGDSYGTFQELQNEIDSVYDGGTLNLTKNYKYVNGSGDGISIYKPITIDGQGFNIDGNDQSRIFNITGENVVLKNLNLVNGMCTNTVFVPQYGNVYLGSGIIWYGNNGTLINSTLSKNGRSSIFWIGNNGTIINSNIVKNSGSYGGGGIYWLGDNGLVLNSNISMNIERDMGGGGIKWYGNNGKIINSIFYKNDVPTIASGGAVDWVGDNGFIYNSSFIKNAAGYFGSAICWHGKNGFVSNSFFMDNNLFCPIRWFGVNGTLFNSTMNESLFSTWQGDYGKIINCIFESDTPQFKLEGLHNQIFNITYPVIKYVGGSERFIVTLIDGELHPIPNANVKITINGITYEKTTDKDGRASLGLNLNPGNYTISTEYRKNQVLSPVVIKSTINGSDISKTFKNKTQYSAKFLDENGNLLKNTNVDFNINGVFYTRKTNNDGIASLNINLNPGEYIITAINPINNEMHSNNVTILSSIVETNDVTIYYKNGTKYSVRILGDNGKPVGAGVKVKFNINGVFYDRTTDANGYAGLNINLGPGKYTITAEYNGLRASNTIKVLPVLETRDLSMKFRDGSQFEAKILDGQGRPYSNQIVTFNINGVFYERVTDDNGVARLSINLLAGDYIITSTFNGLNAANNVKIAPDYLYYTIGNNPLDYDYYMNEYNRFTFDWYYSPQWDAMVRTIYDIYGNVGLEVRDQDVHFGIKYYCYEASTHKEFTLNSAGEIISWCIDHDNVVEYIRYDKDNNIIERGVWD